VITGRKLLREARAALDLVAPNKYREALANLVGNVDTMIAQFAED
jgi:hypothetical protein